MWRLPLLLAALGPLACGYHLAGSYVTVPGDIRSLSVGDFANHSRQFGLGKALAFALEGEFYRSGVLRVMEDPESGEGVVTGTIREFTTQPVAFAADDEALQYEATLTVDARLTRRSDGAVLWRGSSIWAIEQYNVNQDAVVPSSSQFQRGTLNFSALEDLTNVQFAETEKRLAIERLVRSIVRDVHDRILDDF